MSEIRLRYAGLVIFISRIISIGTGAAFVLLITRNLSTQEFGIWGNINDLLGYFTIPAFIFPFWAGRFVARKHVGSAKTGLVSNLIISLIVLPIYLFSIPTITSALNISENQVLPYTLVSLQIVVSYVLYTFEHILQVRRPQTIGYVSLVSEVTKVIIGLVFIPWLRILGAVCVILVASLVQLAFYLRLTISDLGGSVKWNYTREWLSASFFNVFNLVGQRIGALNLIFLFILGGSVVPEGGKLARGFYGAAQAIASVVGHSASLGFALYPKLLSEEKAEDASKALKMILMFAIPMTVGTIVLSESYLIIFDPEFLEVKSVLIVLALGFLFWSVSNFFETVIYGTEKLDEKAKISIRVLVRSRMFILGILPYFYSIVTLPALLYFLTSAPRLPVESALFLALVELAAGVALLIIKYIIANRCLPLDFPRNTVAKYCLASAVMSVVLVVIPQQTRISLVFLTTLVGAATYFAILFLIDRETRETIRLAVKKVQKNVKL